MNLDEQKFIAFSPHLYNNLFSFQIIEKIFIKIENVQYFV